MSGPENCARPVIGQAPEACIESRIGDVIGNVYVRACELAGRRKPLGLPVDPLVENLALRVLARVS